MPSVQKDAPTGGGESISQSEVRFAHVHGLKAGVGTPVLRYSPVSIDLEFRRKGPNSCRVEERIRMSHSTTKNEQLKTWNLSILEQFSNLPFIVIYVGGHLEEAADRWRQTVIVYYHRILLQSARVKESYYRM